MDSTCLLSSRMDSVVPYSSHQGMAEDATGSQGPLCYVGDRRDPQSWSQASWCLLRFVGTPFGHTHADQRGDDTAPWYGSMLRSHHHVSARAAHQVTVLMWPCCHCQMLVHSSGTEEMWGFLQDELSQWWTVWRLHHQLHPQDVLHQQSQPPQSHQVPQIQLQQPNSQQVWISAKSPLSALSLTSLKSGAFLQNLRWCHRWSDDATVLVLGWMDQPHLLCPGPPARVLQQIQLSPVILEPCRRQSLPCPRSCCTHGRRSCSLYATYPWTGGEVILWMYFERMPPLSKSLNRKRSKWHALISSNVWTVFLVESWSFLLVSRARVGGDLWPT